MIPVEQALPSTLPSVMERLRDETAALHKYAESTPLQQMLLRGGLTRADYVAWIAQRWCVHHALDRALQMVGSHETRVLAVVEAEQFQTHAAEFDLRWFGIDLATIRPVPGTEALQQAIFRWQQHRPLSLLGALYVLEGSKNGSIFLARLVRRAYGLDSDGTRYLDPHGEQQRAVWAAFKARMNAQSFSQPEQQQMIEAAQETFRLIAASDIELSARFAPPPDLAAQPLVHPA